jgi:hypothetical protein
VRAAGAGDRWPRGWQQCVPVYTSEVASHVRSVAVPQRMEGTYAGAALERAHKLVVCEHGVVAQLLLHLVLGSGAGSAVSICCCVSSAISGRVRRGLALGCCAARHRRSNYSRGAVEDGARSRAVRAHESKHGEIMAEWSHLQVRQNAQLSKHGRMKCSHLHDGTRQI